MNTSIISRFVISAIIFLILIVMYSFTKTGSHVNRFRTSAPNKDAIKNRSIVYNAAVNIG